MQHAEYVNCVQLGQAVSEEPQAAKDAPMLAIVMELAKIGDLYKVICKARALYCICLQLFSLLLSMSISLCF